MKVAALIVTHNRLPLLKQSVAALKAQTRACEQIFVVNNASTDGTREWLNAEPGITPIHQGNEGGAGGFHTGIRAAYEAGADWIWCMDDDTIPKCNALEALLGVSKADDEMTGFLASRVLWKDGTPHVMNLQPLHPSPETVDLLMTQRLARLQSSSFVSTLVARRAVAACGLPIREFFIWHDDVEYTQRIIAKGFTGYLVLDSVVLHDTVENTGVCWGELSERNLGKYFYGMRNTLYATAHLNGHPLFRWPRAFREYLSLVRILRRNLPAGLAFQTAASLFWSLLAFRPNVVDTME